MCDLQQQIEVANKIINTAWICDCIEEDDKKKSISENDEILSSYKNCKVKCKQCNKEMNFETFKTHKENCIFTCPFGCGCNVTISNLKDHFSQNCPKCMNKCCYSIFGCPWSGRGGSDYHSHLQNCEFAQFGLFKMISVLSPKMNEMKTEINE